MNQRWTTSFALALAIMLASLTAEATAAPIFKITEIYVGLDGEDGTVDWFEVTNYGDMDGDTAGLYYDDDSADPTEDSPLPSLVLAPGKSAVFLLTDAPAEISTFESVWGTGIPLGLVDGAGLGQSGDAVFLFDGNSALANTVDSVVVPSAGDSQLQTFEISAEGVVGLSILGQRGAYESNPFFNDNLGLPGDMATLVGSPAAVPEPSTMVLLALGGIGFCAVSYRRMRQK